MVFVHGLKNFLISLLCISIRPFGLSTTWDLEIEPNIRQVTFASRKGVGIKSCEAHLLLRNGHFLRYGPIVRTNFKLLDFN
ncbi:hypothetical protein C1H46_019637 [Malus baccata]|uniref:Uncharacterized protein n=1 Tax=Malus baccata TaxID=106549 RepID=A0A540M7Q3_MALBA|nr:hypothetical protein C1H46_019637 [Malus baccata]